MNNVKLNTLYHGLTDRPGTGSPLDAGQIVALARGEKLGTQHDTAVAALARSADATALYRIARGITLDAERLAAAIAPARTTKALPGWTRWALAASVLAAALLIGRDLVLDHSVEPAPAEVVAYQPSAPTPLFSASFEHETAAAAHAEPIFRGGFDG